MSRPDISDGFFDRDGNAYRLDGKSLNFVAVSGTSTWTQITASGVTLAAGTTSSAATDLNEAFDGNIYNLVEANAGTPGQSLELGFGPVEDFKWVHVMGQYLGQSTHAVGIYLYNFSTDTWNCFHLMESSFDAIKNYSFFVPHTENYIHSESRSVRLLFLHSAQGNQSHDTFIDVANLIV